MPNGNNILHRKDKPIDHQCTDMVIDLICSSCTVKPANKYGVGLAYFDSYKREFLFRLYMKPTLFRLF